MLGRPCDYGAALSLVMLYAVFHEPSACRRHTHTYFRFTGCALNSPLIVPHSTARFPAISMFLIVLVTFVLVLSTLANLPSP